MLALAGGMRPDEKGAVVPPGQKRCGKEVGELQIRPFVCDSCAVSCTKGEEEKGRNKTKGETLMHESKASAAFCRLSFPSPFPSSTRYAVIPSAAALGIGGCSHVAPSADIFATLVHKG